jgi:hypothetical protein
MVIIRGYVGGVLEEETERPVRELTSFFTAAQMAGRNLPREMSKALGELGNDLAAELRQEKLFEPLIPLKELLEDEKERFADYGFNRRVEPFGERTRGGRRGVQLIATSHDGMESHTFSIEIGRDGLKSVTILVDGNFDPRIATGPFMQLRSGSVGDPPVGPQVRMNQPECHRRHLVKERERQETTPRRSLGSWRW